MEDLPVASSGFVGRNEDDDEKQVEHVTLEDLNSSFCRVAFEGR